MAKMGAAATFFTFAQSRPIWTVHSFPLLLPTQNLSSSSSYIYSFFWYGESHLLWYKYQTETTATTIKTKIFLPYPCSSTSSLVVKTMFQHAARCQPGSILALLSRLMIIVKLFFHLGRKALEDSKVTYGSPWIEQEPEDVASFSVPPVDLFINSNFTLIWPNWAKVKIID